jgi:peptidoglycan hydrolase-like protein with peptidoglycan-binding domain
MGSAVVRRQAFVFLIFLILSCSFPLAADELTEIIQRDLTTLGYDTGGVTGELSTKTIIAISKFQTEHELEVTGEPSPQLAGVIKAQLSGSASNAAYPAVASSPASPVTAERTEEELQAAQQACLQQKVQAQQAANKKKSGFGKLLRAATRTMSTFGSSEVSRQVSRTSYEVYSANASYEDVKSAAEDLGLSETDIEECRNP